MRTHRNSNTEIPEQKRSLRMDIGVLTHRGLLNKTDGQNRLFDFALFRFI